MVVKKESAVQPPADAIQAGVLPVSNDDSLIRTVEEFLPVLLSINTAIATIRERKELFTAIIQKIKPVIPVDNTGILVLDETGTRWQDWTNADNYQETGAATQLQQLGYDKFQPLDRFTEYTLNHSGIMTVAQFREQYPEHPFGPVMWEAGLREMMFTPLVTGGRKLGVLFFDAEREGTYTEGHFPLFKAIANQLALAVANILANEEILEREREKSVLLGISEAIAKIHDRKELLKVIYASIQPIFPFDNAGLFIVDREKDLCYELLDSEVFPDGLQTQLSETNELGPWRLSLFNPQSWALQDEIVISCIEQEASYAAGTPVEGQFKAGLEYGLKHMIGGPLYTNGKKIGVICFNSFRENAYTPAYKYMFKSISDQVAVAVANILANEEILEREREKSILLSISKSIAAVHNTVELLSVIREKAQQLIPFYDTGILMVEPNGQYHYDLAVRVTGWDSSEVNQQLQAASLDRVPHQDSYLAAIIQKIEAAKTPRIEDWDLAFAQFSHPFFSILQEGGYKEALVTTLKSGGKTIGTLWLNSKAKEHFHAKQFEVFQALADQVAVAVANILANEEILEREREKATLLSISEAIARIQDRKELLRVIYANIQPVFPFDNAGLFVMDWEKDLCYELLDSEAFPDDLQTQLTEANQLGPARISLCSPESWWMKSEIVINDMKTEASYATGTPAEAQFKAGLEYGLKHMIGGPLFTNGKKIGAICFNSFSENAYTPASLYMFRSISDQVAVAVANILANEEILEREREKATLLSISSAISCARNAVELLTVIREKAQQLIPFHDTGILIVEDDEQHHYDLAVTVQGWDPSETNQLLHEAGLFNIDHPGSYVAHAMDLIEEARGPIIEDWERRFEEFDYPFFPISKRLGFKEAMTTHLKSGGRTFGTLWLNSKEKNHFHPKQFEVFQALADQVAVAVANILANEEILEREREKALLLSLSEDMATIRDREDLWRVMMEKVQPLAAFDDAVLLILSADLQQYESVLTMSPEERKQHHLYDKVVGNHAVAESPVKWYLERKENLIVQDLQELETDPTFPNADPAVRMMKETGLWYSLVHKLHWGDKLLGLLFFHYRSRHALLANKQHVTKGIADQLAVAVANILANEEILQQKADIETREHEKTLQITLTDSLTRETTWARKLLKAVEALQPFVPFDYAAVGVEKDGQPGIGYGYRRIGFNEYQTIGTEDFLRMSGLTREKYAKLRAERSYREPLLLDGKAFEAHCCHSGLERLLARLFGLQSSLVLPVPLSRDGQFVLSLFSRKPDTYQSHHFQLLSRLEGPLAVTLDRLLAYEEIEKLSERLKEENTYLLEEVKTNYNFEEIIGTSKALHEALAKVVQVAATDATVLIGGETGTGKELVARAIHNLSGRRQKLLVKLNCACLPAQLIESELFGHEKGSFTGAFERRIGKFELAHGGTIFLDEIGEMPPELQVKLLRVLQEREIERLGGKGPIRTDVRVIAATNRDLEKEVIAGRFRADLYFRLNVFPVTLPPLRERREDIPLLATHFLGKCNKKMGKHLSQLSGAALQEMMTYHWPGNIRELEHVIEQSVITSTGKSLELARPLRLTKASIFPLEEMGQSPLKSLADNEREHILRVLKLTQGRIRGAGGAAEILDIIPTTLEGRMRKLGIKKEHVFKKA
jgi:transcriptional regulator with GAF, ATPase, and Fis domain